MKTQIVYVTYRKSPVSPRMTLSLKQPLRPKAEPWIGQVDVAKHVAQTLVLAGYHTAAVMAPDLGIESRVLGVPLVNLPLFEYEEARSWRGRRVARPIHRL